MDHRVSTKDFLRDAGLGEPGIDHYGDPQDLKRAQRLMLARILLTHRSLDSYCVHLAIRTIPPSSVADRYRVT